MRDGFKRLVHPATALADIDLAATRASRKQVHEQFRLRNHLRALLPVPIDQELVRVGQYELVDEGETERPRELG